MDYPKVIGGVVALSLGIACGCNRQNSASLPVAAAAPASHTPSTLPGVARTTAEGAATATPPVDYYETSGPIVVEDQVDVLAQREGMLAEILVDTGARVRKGQLLAKIDDRQLEADREGAEAKIRSLENEVKNWEAEAKVLESDYERDQEMWKAQLITAKQLEHSRYKMIGSGYELEREKQNLRVAKATLRSLELEIEKTRITAPFAGVVARRYVRAGQKVASNDRLFWISATSPVNVQFTLPEYFLGKIAPGQEVSVTSPLFPRERHIAKVRLVSPVADASSGTIEVQAELAPSPTPLLPGTNAVVRVAKPK